MLLTVTLGLIAAVLLVPFGSFFKDWKGILISIIPGVLFAFFLSKIGDVSSGNVIFESTRWVPSLGIDLDFRLDGLSLLFALLITGIGSLVFLYSSAYLKGDKHLDRYWGYLLLFMSSMLGLVLSDNIFLMFIFWELTSVSSFFLIGYNNEDDDSRRSALISYAITGLGGFFLLIGLVLAGYIVGSYSFNEMLLNAGLIKNSELYPLILASVLIAAFTKSAQFPFHFWLPKAMAAPTPISAYLHSATMVKAGIYIMARFTPVLGGTVYWQWVLIGVGGFTMLYGAGRSLFKDDLKGVLAYSTVAALGVLTFLIGLGTEKAIIAACVFILVHALYKASLFLVTGVIDMETGTRDLNQLSGLGSLMMPLAVAGGLAALSSAGVPFTYGFIGKDLIYESTLSVHPGWGWYLTVLALLTNIGLVAAGFLVGFKPFFGKKKEDNGQIKLSSKRMWLSALILALAGIFFGVFPQIAGTYLTESAVSGVLQFNTSVELKIWHGFNTVILLSIATIGVGTLVYLADIVRIRRIRPLKGLNRLDTEGVFNKIYFYGKLFAEKYTNYFHNGYLRSYLLKIIIFAEILLAFGLYQLGWVSIDFSTLSAISAYDIAIVVMMIGSLYLTLTAGSRLNAVVALSIVGYAICLLFVVYSAPDLAMTQFTIDTLTVVLFVLVLYRLPGFIKYKNGPIIVRDGIVSLIFGVQLGIVCLAALQEPAQFNISDFYGKFAYTLGHGRNVVNVILVDFRGFDTMFEIVVLTTSAIGVYSLLKLRLK